MDCRGWPGLYIHRLHNRARSAGGPQKMLGWVGLASGGIEAYPYSFVSSSAEAAAGGRQNPKETACFAKGWSEPHGHAVCDGPTTPDRVSARIRDAD
jgi:hypothetical protein